MAIERCETGIIELDQILRGGIPRRNVVLMAGGSGMGKTTLTMEFLAHGAAAGEPGLFLSVTEPIEMLDRNYREYRFLDPEHLDSKMIRLVDLRAIMRKIGLEGPTSMDTKANDRFVAALGDIVKEYGIKRLVIDSITAVCQRLPDQGLMRDLIFKLGLALVELDCTSILTSETPPRELKYSTFGVEEFISDGIIFLSEIERHGDLVRTLQVMKMRGTEHSRALFMMDLSEYGVSLAPLLREAGGTDD